MKNSFVTFLCVTALLCALGGCGDQSIDASLSANKHEYPYKEGDDIPAMAYIEHDEVYNPESVIPPQCYTKTNGVNNPCYACHQSYSKSEQRPNQMGDGSLQGNYEFSDAGLSNSWKNLFVDRTQLIKEITDESIDEWVEQDNYQSAMLAKQNNQQALPSNMHINQLASPDKAFATDGLAKDGSNWVAFNYKPFPSTFWPTNGSTGDAMIRLPEAFRHVDGEYSKSIYFLNLALVELALKDEVSVSIEPTDEKSLNIDLDQDGSLSIANTIARRSHYIGDASNIESVKMLYPAGTEFLHTVRYIGVDDKGGIYNASRMKEVRYMKKHVFRSKESLSSAYYAEAKEKHFENLPQTRYLGEKGIDNGFGWTINAYIEDEKGELRAQHEQELAFCNGCHKTVGSTFDQTFSFARKVSGEQGWGYINLRAMQDVPNINESAAEYLTYMQRVGGGDEFRQNQEMLDKWFLPNGKLDQRKVAQANSVYDLITPSPERARKLNKAYLTIVNEQSYLFGRDATLTKAKNVLQQIDTQQKPLLPQHQHQWDMRLNWKAAEHTAMSQE